MYPAAATPPPSSFKTPAVSRTTSRADSLGSLGFDISTAVALDSATPSRQSSVDVGSVSSAAAKVREAAPELPRQPAKLPQLPLQFRRALSDYKTLVSEVVQQHAPSNAAPAAAAVAGGRAVGSLNVLTATAGMGRTVHTSSHSFMDSLSAHYGGSPTSTRAAGRREEPPAKPPGARSFTLQQASAQASFTAVVATYLWTVEMLQGMQQVNVQDHHLRQRLFALVEEARAMKRHLMLTLNRDSEQANPNPMLTPRSHRDEMTASEALEEAARWRNRCMRAVLTAGVGRPRRSGSSSLSISRVQQEARAPGRDANPAPRSPGSLCTPSPREHHPYGLWLPCQCWRLVAPQPQPQPQPQASSSPSASDPPPTQPGASSAGWLQAFPPAVQHAMAASVVGSAAAKMGSPASGALLDASSRALTLTYRSPKQLVAHGKVLHQLQTCLFSLYFEAKMASCLIPASLSPDDEETFQRQLAQCRLAHSLLFAGSQARKSFSIVEAIEEHP